MLAIRDEVGTRGRCSGSLYTEDDAPIVNKAEEGGRNPRVKWTEEETLMCWRKKIKVVCGGWRLCKKGERVGRCRKQRRSHERKRGSRNEGEVGCG